MKKFSGIVAVICCLLALPALAGTTVTKALDAKTSTGVSAWIPTQENGLSTSPGVVGAVQVTLYAGGATTSSVTYQMSPNASTAFTATATFGAGEKFRYVCVAY